MNEITIHTGAQGESNKIHFEWFDENNVRQYDTLIVRVLTQDKPRKIVLVLNGSWIALLDSSMR